MILRWLPALLWGIVIFVLSLMPGGNADKMMFGIPHFDKIGHFGMYAGWAFLVFGALPGKSVRFAFFFTLLLCGMSGVLLEFGQLYLATGRSFEVADMVANTLGAFVGLLVAWKSRQMRRGRV